jgi:serine O-acetyltransferase
VSWFTPCHNVATLVGCVIPGYRCALQRLLDPILFDNIRSDFRAHDCRWGAQGFWALWVYRFGRWRYSISPRAVRMPFSFAYRILFKIVQIVTGIELPCEVQLGRNFIIDHSGGIVISGYAKFGDNCRIRTGVVVGLARASEPCAPIFGDNVDIGAGAKVLGPIRIGNNVLIGANAVVVRDVPPDSVVTGVPGRIRPLR